MPIQAGGLASGLDTASIIDSLVTLQQRPVAGIDDKIQAVRVKVSGLSTIATQLDGLGSALKSLQSGGVRAAAIASTHTTFSASTTTGAVPGRFSVQVESLATAARARSGLLDSETAPVAGTVLTFGINGVSTDIAIDDGMPLDEVAERINSAGLSLNAAVLFDGSKAILSVSRAETGHAIGADPSTALTITETVTGSGGQTLGLAVTTQAQNTVAQIDGLRFERQGTSIAGAIPGVTVEATATGAAETVVVSEDSAKTKERLTAFVTAYNTLAKSLQGELDLKPETDRSRSLGGDATLRLLQGRLQAVMSTSLGTGGTGLQSLADIGLKSNRDGTISLDDAAFNEALRRDGPGLDRLFGETGTVATAISSLVEDYTGTEGIITQRKTSLGEETSRLEDDKVVAERRIELFRERLVQQFTAMESIVASMTAMSTFLTNAFAKRTES
jgi:flagellar hook-associated protein 2